MKAMKMLMMAALTILSVSLFAQDSTKQKSKTQKQKMEMMKYSCPMHPDVTSDKPGKCSKCGMDLKEKEQATVAYSCPMKCEGDKTYDKPGKCPKCGMALKEQKDDHSNHKH